MDQVQKGRIAKVLLQINQLVEQIADELTTKANPHSTLPNNRRQAIAQGSRYYFTGLTCSNGHRDKRYTSNCDCAQCQRDSSVRCRERAMAGIRQIETKALPDQDTTTTIDEMTERVAEHVAKKAWLASLEKLLDQ